MATRLIGTDSDFPRLPQGVIDATQGPTAGDVAPGDTLTKANEYTDNALASFYPPPPDTLWVGTDAPTDPAIELWYDTDEAVVDNTSAYAPRASLYLPGTPAATFISTPDPAALAGATQLDIRWIEKPTAYINQVIVAQGTGASPTTSSVVVVANASTANVSAFISNGTVNTSVARMIRPAIGTIGACRVTWRGSDGRVQMFTKSTSTVAGLLAPDGWTQSGADGTGATGALPDRSDVLSIGGYSNGVTAWQTNLYALSIATTIDGTPFGLWRSETMDPTYRDAYANLWTLNGSGYQWVAADGTVLSTSAGSADVAIDRAGVVEIAAPRSSLYLPGTAGNNVTTPDPTALAGATALDIRWIERGLSSYSSNWIFAQATAAAAPNLAFLVQGNVSAFFATTTTPSPAAVTIAGVRPPLGVIRACRLTWRGSDGRVQAFTKDTTTLAGMLDNTGWIKVGADATTSLGALVDVAHPLTIGSSSAGSASAIFDVYAASLSTTIDGTPFGVWRSDAMAPAYTDAYGTRWNVNGTAYEWRGPDGLRLRGAEPREGDTGWRLLTSWDAAGVVSGIPLNAGWKPRPTLAGSIRLRRIGSTVWSHIAYVAVAVASTNDSVIPTVGSGWWATISGFVPVDLRSTSGAAGHTLAGLQVTGGGLSRLGGQTLAVDEVIYPCHVSWTTDQAWPTTLPGTPG